MRSLFDQYGQRENQLTHALACCLAEDARLLHRFAQWATRKTSPAGPLAIFQQSVPWAPEASEVEAKRLGLPDAWISSESGWALVIESKIAAPARLDQLKRHRDTATNRGWGPVCVLLLVATGRAGRMPDAFVVRRWSELYTWLCKQVRISPWADRLRIYMEVLEGRLIAEERLKDGALTVFSGIPFNASNPWTYVEAKRLIKLAMEDLRSRRTLATHLHANLKGQGRKAITGKVGIGVWDFLPLRPAASAQTFTSFPHLTLSIERDRALVIVTVPNGVKSAFRRNLLDQGFEAFSAVIERVHGKLARVTRNDRGAVPLIWMVQRRFPSQRASEIVDAQLGFDLRTAFGASSRRGSVCAQPQWLDAAFNALSHKRSNLQFAIGVAFPYAYSRSVGQRAWLDRVVETWLACKPLLQTMGALKA